MPQEIVIILAVLIGAIWLLVKIVQGISQSIDQAAKSYNEAAAKRKATRYSRKRDSLRQYVHFLLFDELDSFEKKLEAVRVEFEKVQRLTRWAVSLPAWTNATFSAYLPPRKYSEYGEMCIDDINAILSPDSDISTWFYKESELINRQCEYPVKLPASSPNEFTPFPILTIDLKKAVFEIDAQHVSQKDVDRYFADEQNKVLAYNNRRADLSAKAANLNSAIEEWNRKNQVSWQHYVAEFKELKAAELLAFQTAAELYTQTCSEEKSYFNSLLERYKNKERPFVIERLGFVLDKIKFPGSVPHTWEIDFDEEQQIAVIDFGLPDVVHRQPYKIAILKSGAVKKPLNQTERKELVPKAHPAILLRIAYEVFRNDANEIINLLVLNGWTKFDDPATGMNTKAYTASLMVARDQISALNLAKIDPIAAFHNLHGKSAGKLVEIIPIEPLLSLNRNDSRFVNAKQVLQGLGKETNLAAMDWQDFEHLIRELFEKEFSGRGAEVKITQASRDRGVDAIVFDPDPIHGGKYVIQAKRYTNTVDVSAVRDLCAVVKKEGASRGILVTTSTYGGDAYAFANNEPVTLLNGAELLGLLKKHGYTFRINLQEARHSI